MTTKVSDERLRELISDGINGMSIFDAKVWIDDATTACENLRDSRALVKEYEEYLNAYRATLSVNAARATDLDAFLARVRGEI